MVDLSAVIAAILVSLALFQSVFAIRFAALLRRYHAPRISDEKLPHASILLTLRGADPFLGKGLRQLMSQNYPSYDLRIVVDDLHDPSVEVVREAASAMAFAELELDQLRERPSRCSLKCAALAQLAGDLGEETEVVVLADADLVSHPDWMRELVAPLLADEGIGATYGNRWFWPEKARWGSLVRYLWNVAAVVPMVFCWIPWGGTFAMRADTLREANLPDLWSRAVVEDAPIHSALDRLGRELHFVPGLMMANREDCGLRYSLDFIKRQLTWTRIYHSNWWVVVLHAVLTSGALMVGAGLVSYGGWTGAISTVAMAAIGILGYLLIMAGLMGLLEASVRNVVRKRGEPVGRFSPVTWIRAVLAIPMAQGIHFVAVMLAMFRKEVAWRGVTYRIRGPWEIHLVAYQPYRMKRRETDANTSL